MSIQLVVFDMAGTTVDEGKIVYQCVQQVLSESGFDFSLQEVMQHVGGMNKKEGIQLMLELKMEKVEADFLEKLFQSFKEKVEKAYRENEEIKEKEGASELFQKLHDKGVKVALDTGYHRSTADILINRMGWIENGLVDYTVTSDEVVQGRPAPFMIQKIMDQLDIKDVKEVAKVGDMRSDIEEGLNTGCTYVVGISSIQYNQKDLIEMGATHAIDKLSELYDILFNDAG